MRALFFDGKLKFTAEHPRPERSDQEACVAVSLAGICATDIEIVKGYMGFRGILGHEFVGKVLESGRSELVGKRVVGEINCPCGSCELCRRGLGNHCPERSVLGIKNRDGAFAEYLVLPDKNLHLVPDTVSDRDAVFSELLAAACRAFEQANIREGEQVAVLGDGRLGLLIAAVFIAHGVEITVIGKHGEKLAIAHGWGARTELIPGDPRDLRADIVVDATGSASGLAYAMEMVRPGGRIVMKTTIAAPHALSLAPLVVNEITLIGSRCGSFDHALALLAGKRVGVGALISAEYPLERAEEAFKRAGSGGALKVLFDISGHHTG
ncbi:MAG: alcohol dehydrogenase catalytic domain-containing protein [Candidatus Aureabacteria bacterium]|nr:alcohol dehydrogenase catalytic domain-containing protein [Candidatus Auribacterota bacterium]